MAKGNTLIAPQQLVLDKIETEIKIGVPCVRRQVKQAVGCDIGAKMETAFLGLPFTSRLSAFSGSPNSSRGLANGRLGRLPGGSRFFLRVLSRQALRGESAFLG